MQTYDSGFEVGSTDLSQSLRFRYPRLMDFWNSISPGLLGVNNSRYTRTRLACWNVHFWVRRVKYLHFAPSVSQFWSNWTNTMSCQLSVGHDHLLDYSADRGHNCRTCRTLLVGFGVLPWTPTRAFFRTYSVDSATLGYQRDAQGKRRKELTEAGHRRRSMAEGRGCRAGSMAESKLGSKTNWEFQKLRESTETLS